MKLQSQTPCNFPDAETDLGCECGYNDRSWLHQVYECPRFKAAHHAVAPHEWWTNLSPHELMADWDEARQFIGFLATTRAAFKPQDELSTPFDPGGPTPPTLPTQPRDRGT